MKLLLLATCGKKNSEEDTKPLHVYFSSVKKFIVPHFDTKIILFNSSLSGDSCKSKTYELIKKYQLQDIVVLKSIDELDLSEKAVTFLKKEDWMNRIGLIMNVMFDYAKKENFYNADWIFHTDTDIKFLDNFHSKLSCIDALKKINESIVITLSGDTFYENIRYGTTMFAFHPPSRINFYENKDIDKHYHLSKPKKEFRDNYVTNTDKLIYTTQQQKIRNDFVGISNKAAHSIEFNWVNYSYTSDFASTLPGAEELEKWWSMFGSTHIDFRIAHDKGSIPQMKFQEGVEQGYDSTMKIQLSAYRDMAYHYGSGWEGNQNFEKQSLQDLKREFLDFQNIWEPDYS